MEEKRIFGARLKELRIRAHLSQRKLASKVGVDFTYISRLENGLSRPPSEKVLLQLSEILHVNKDELITLAGRIPSGIAQKMRDRALFKFGARLKELRIKAQLSQLELASKVGIDSTYLSKIESGEKPPPRENVLSKLAEYLDVNKGELLALAGKIPYNSIPIQKRIKTQVKHWMSLSKLSMPKVSIPLRRVAMPITLTIAIGASLWFAAPTPARAITIAIDNPSNATVGTVYNFTATVNVQDTDLLPITLVDLKIDHPVDRDNPSVTYSHLPLSAADSPKTYTGLASSVDGYITTLSGDITAAGQLTVSATFGSNWAYGTGTRYGYGYGYSSEHWETINPLGTGYGYGYGYGSDYTGATSITYDCAWTPSSQLIAGSYDIRVIVYGGDDIDDASKAFTNHEASTTITLGAAAAVDDDVPDDSGGGFPTSGGASTEGEQGVTNVSRVVNARGIFTADVRAQSEDNRVTLDIPRYTKGFTKAGDPLSEISIEAVAEIPTSVDPPDGAMILTYDFGPDGATFSEPITLTFNYNEADIPSGVLEAELVIVYWDGSAWVELDNIEINTDTNTITGEIDHFTIFSVIGRSAPAPAPAPVVPAPAPAPAPPPAPVVPAPAPAPAPPPAPVVPAPAPAPAPAPSTTNWLLIGIISVAAIIVIGFVIWYVLRRRG
ncbi:helix-turn-helix domain-containing protein [Chloroflexota bacterium]